MKIFAGLSRTDYEDVFRAVGALIDEQGWSNVSLMEVDEGLIVQVMVRPDQRETKPRLETYLLTDTDLERVLRDAVMHRNKREQGRQADHQPAALTAAPPPPSKLVEGVFATKASPEGNGPAWPSQPASPPPTSRPIPDSRDNMRGAAMEFSEISSQLAQITQAPADTVPHLPILPTRSKIAAPLPTATEENEVTPFAPAPMRLSNQPPENKIDTGAARAAVVMAHIVAARLRSGVPMTSDDPDLASLLEQVRALDESNIGEKS